MASTLTSRLKLFKPTPSSGETFRSTDFNANMDAIDAGGNGTFVCTSTTRPADPYTGMQIYETDTKRRRHYDGKWVRTGLESFFKVYRSANKTVTVDGWNNIDWDTEVEDEDSAFTLTTNGGYFVAPRSGLFSFKGKVQVTISPAPGGPFAVDSGVFESTDSGASWTGDILRGSAISLNPAAVAVSSGYTVLIDGTYSVIAGRAYSARVYSIGSGGTRTIQGGSYVSEFSGHYL